MRPIQHITNSAAAGRTLCPIDVSLGSSSPGTSPRRKVVASAGALSILPKLLRARADGEPLPKNKCAACDVHPGLGCLGPLNTHRDRHGLRFLPALLAERREAATDTTDTQKE